MEKITSISDLKNAIQILEIEQDYKGKRLKEEFYLTYESLKPFKILQSALKDVASSPYLIENILTTVMGLTSGYLSKRLVVGASGGALRKIIGSVLQMGVTTAVTKHPDTLMSIGKFLYNSVFQRKGSKQNTKDKNKKNQTGP
jgi:hypothetical protein